METQKQEQKKLQFGLNRALPANARAAWGARAIDESTQFSMVWDRQDMFGSDEDKTLLKFMLNEERVLDVIKNRFTELRRIGGVPNNSEEIETLFENDKLVAKASCNRSYGYVYLVVYVK